MQLSQYCNSDSQVCDFMNLLLLWPHLSQHSTLFEKIKKMQYHLLVVRCNVNMEMCLLLTVFDLIALTVNCGVQSCSPLFLPVIR